MVYFLIDPVTDLIWVEDSAPQNVACIATSEDESSRAWVGNHIGHWNRGNIQFENEVIASEFQWLSQK